MEEPKFKRKEKFESDKRFVAKRKYNIKQLWESHHEIARQVALGRGNSEIAQELNLTPQMVSNVRNSPLAQEKIERFRNVLDAQTVDIAKRIYDFAPKALEYLEKVISGEEEVPASIRAKYASAHLARAGYGEVRKVASLSASLTKDDIERIKERSLDAIEVQYETISEQLNGTANGTAS